MARVKMRARKGEDIRDWMNARKRPVSAPVEDNAGEGETVNDDIRNKLHASTSTPQDHADVLYRKLSDLSHDKDLGDNVDGRLRDLLLESFKNAETETAAAVSFVLDTLATSWEVTGFARDDSAGEGWMQAAEELREISKALRSETHSADEAWAKRRLYFSERNELAQKRIAELEDALRLFADKNSYVYASALEEPHEFAQQILDGVRES